MEKIDIRKQYKHLYLPSSREVSLVEVPEMQFVMVDGKGNPNESKEFQDAIGALYGSAYTLKFASKKGPLQKDFTVPPLEGLWWTGAGGDFKPGSKAQWNWTVMIMLPDFITHDMFEKAVGQLKQKKENPALGKVRLERFKEGISVQIMHIGPYSEELPNIEKLHAFIKENSYKPNGKHHEIYLGDPRRAAPEKLKTVLRQPVQTQRA